MLLFKGQQESIKILAAAFSRSGIIGRCTHRYVLETGFRGECKPSAVRLWLVRTHTNRSPIPGCSSTFLCY